MAAENNIVGEVGLRVTPVDAGFEAGVKRIIDRIEGSVGTAIKPKVDTTDAERSVDNLVQKTNEVGNAWIRAGVEAGAFTAAVFGVQRAIEGVINKFAGLFDQLTQARAGFTSILRSDTAGNNLLDEIREFARVSPFVTQELVNYSQQLLGVGVASEKIVPLLENVGDVISSVGGDTQNIGRVLFTLTQIQSIGRLTGQDAIQLQSALIPITRYLADYLNITTAQVKKLQEQGQISAETVFAAISAQGERVQGAMANATRTIGGARSVLNDTVVNFLTAQPVLNKIYEDIVAGILSIANALGDENVTGAINRFFDGVGKIYDALRPVIEQLASLGGSGGLATLNAFASALEVVGTVLETIPEPVLKLLATFFAGMAALRAPLALIQYVNRIREFTTGLVGAATGQARLRAETDATTAAQERQAFALTKSARALQLIAAAGVAAGAVVQDGQGGARDAAGSFLQTTALGASLGAAGGPAGIAAGAIGGAVVSSITSIISANAKAKEAAEKAGEDLAQTYASNFIRTLNLEFGTNASPDRALTEFFAEFEKGARVIDTYTNVIEDYRKEQEALDDALAKGTITWTEHGAATNELNDKIDRANDVLEQTRREQEALAADDTYAGYLQGIVDKLGLVEGIAPGALRSLFPDLSNLPGDINALPDSLKLTQRQLELLGGGALPQTAEEVDFLRTQLARLGLTFEEVATQTPEQIDAAIAEFIALPDAFKDAQAEAIRFGQAMDTAAKNATEYWSPFRREIEAVANQLNEVSATSRAFGQLYDTDELTGLLQVRENITAAEINSIGGQLLTSSTREYERVLAELSGTVSEDEAKRQASIASTRLLAGEFEALQNTLGQTDAQFAQLLESAGLYNLFSSTFSETNNVNVESLDALSERLGIARDLLIEILDIGPVNETTQIISTTETDEAIQRLQEINDLLNDPGNFNQYNGLLEERNSLLDLIELNTRDITAAIEEQEAAQQSLFRSFVGQAQQYLTLLDTQRSFNDSLGTLFEVADDNTLRVVDDIETIAAVAEQILTGSVSQFEQALGQGATQVEANADAATFAAQRFEALQIALGQTDEQFRATLRSIGLFDEFSSATSASADIISGSLAVVAEQLGVTQEELFELTGIIGAIDPNLNIVVTADTSQAIARLEEIQGILTVDERLTQDRRDQLIQERNALEQQIANAAITGVDPNTQAQLDAIAVEEARRAQQMAEQAERELRQWQNAVESSTSNLTSSIEQAMSNVVAAAESWTASIKERTQFEEAVSAQRLAGNAERQVRDLQELTDGLSALRSRGVSDEVLSALGIDNVADVRQVRRLVGSSDTDLARLNQAVADRDQLATNLALSEEDRRTRTNITEAILDAARTLGLENVDRNQAQSISNQFTITAGTNPEELALQILGALTGGRL